MSFIETYVEAGVPALEVLRAMTTHAARLLGVESQRGAVKAGLAAGLVATEGNPLEDVQALKKISFVMKDGNVIKDRR